MFQKEAGALNRQGTKALQRFAEPPAPHTTINGYKYAPQLLKETEIPIIYILKIGYLYDILIYI